ncbi:sigma-70 family RNA polymerase sigma factor [Stenotrophomonas maltophilia]|uniref:RNA polymerase sigma factor n=1 Tax=Stenotrophomonas maltophilia TaxID=40324 RepID=UPI002010608A|nr:sigma-70 family RNA polymerase sigma factor [Stenotrophomonas maltophilia]UQA72615.1 sigma-70 family RNA polymerase sigma factor [Stenotrophomonas maltophilia]
MSTLGRGTDSNAEQASSTEPGIPEDALPTGGNLLAKAYARWRGPILRGLARVRGADGEDALHDGAVKWIAACPALESCDQQGAYLRRTVMNTVADEYREHHAGRRLQTLPLADAEEAGHAMASDESQCPLQLSAQRQRLERLREALAELPERQREAFVLCRFDGLTQEDVAARMQIARRMVVKHLSRAVAYCEVRVRYASLAQMQELHRPTKAGEALAPAIDADFPCR